MAQFPGFRVTRQGQLSFVSENAESILPPSPDGLTEGRFPVLPRPPSGARSTPGEEGLWGSSEMPPLDLPSQLERGWDTWAVGRKDG